jgi:hypothetical protein
LDYNREKRWPGGIRHAGLITAERDGYLLDRREERP